MIEQPNNTLLHPDGALPAIAASALSVTGTDVPATDITAQPLPITVTVMGNILDPVTSLPKAYIVAGPGAFPSQDGSFSINIEGQVHNIPSFDSSIRFDGERSGAILLPPPYIDNRRQIKNTISDPSVTDGWFVLTAQDIVDNRNYVNALNKKNGYAAAPVLTLGQATAMMQSEATYPPDLPVLQLTLDATGKAARLCWYAVPKAGQLGTSFIDSSAWLEFYNLDGTPTGVPNGGKQPNGAVQALFWMYSYIQYYISIYLPLPYDLTAAIPYGYNYWDQQRMNYNTSAKMQQFLSGLNYLTAPVGKKTFFDDVLNASGTVIVAIVGGLASVATLGAASPALAGALVAISAATVKAGMKIGSTEYKIASSNLTAAQGGLQSNAQGVSQAALAGTTQAITDVNAAPAQAGVTDDIKSYYAGLTQKLQSMYTTGKNEIEAKLGDNTRAILMVGGLAVVLIIGTAIYLKEKK